MRGCIFPKDRQDLPTRYIQELLRVLKPGGEARIYPLYIYEEIREERDILKYIEKNKERIDKVLKEIGLEEDEYEFFMHQEEGYTNSWGIKIFKGQKDQEKESME